MKLKERIKKANWNNIFVWAIGNNTDTPEIVRRRLGFTAEQVNDRTPLTVFYNLLYTEWKNSGALMSGKRHILLEKRKPGLTRLSL